MTFVERYDALVFVACEKGVCPKVVMGTGTLIANMHYCGRALVAGSRWCDRHQRG